MFSRVLNANNAEKVLVLASGGLDSSTLVAQAVQTVGAHQVIALSISYGQRHKRELTAAQAVAKYYGIEQRFLDLGALFSESSSALLAHSNTPVPHQSYAEQMGVQGGANNEGVIESRQDAASKDEACASKDEACGADSCTSTNGGSGTAGADAQNAQASSLVSTYVPFRNGLFLSAAAALALSLECSVLAYGAHRDDWAGSAYPDCSSEFVRAMQEAIALGSGAELRLEAPFVTWSKADIVSLGLELSVPYELTWSCYEGGDRPCGQCATCKDRAAAFAANGVSDPLP